MGITFLEAISTWGRAMETKNLTDFELMLDDGFEWISMNSQSTMSRADVISWVRHTEMKIGNYKTLHDGESVICGTHSVFESGRDETIVMCVIVLGENRTKVKKWSITRANFYQNQQANTNPELGYFL
jgi:hypothetical protein